MACRDQDSYPQSADQKHPEPGVLDCPGLRHRAYSFYQDIVKNPLTFQEYPIPLSLRMSFMLQSSHFKWQYCRHNQSVSSMVEFHCLQVWEALARLWVSNRSKMCKKTSGGRVSIMSFDESGVFSILCSRCLAELLCSLYDFHLQLLFLGQFGALEYCTLAVILLPLSLLNINEVCYKEKKTH